MKWMLVFLLLIAAIPVRADPLAVDKSCEQDNDCVVKDVGNCCGYFPACVNVAATPDPEAVAEQCRSEGIAAVCGFEEISSCQCVDHVCQSRQTDR